MKTGRPIKPRTVRKSPEIRQFSPRGRVGRAGHIELKFEEFEAIRLADYVGLDQAEAAKFMGISQQTFSRVLKNGRKRIYTGLYARIRLVNQNTSCMTARLMPMEISI